MKKAHIYNLKAIFEDGREWDLKILAVSITWVFCWIKDCDNVKSMTVEMVKKDAKEVPENFGAKGID